MFCILHKLRLLRFLGVFSTRVGFFAEDRQTKRRCVIHNKSLVATFTCERLFRTTMTPTQNFSSMAGLCEFFSQMRTLGDYAKKSRVSIAVDYLNSHYIENTEIAALASMCYLSEPQFYRLFRREVGQTPIEYRNRLRIDRACSLLLDGECSIGEIASMLGFASLYYFSRTFKQLTGKSPTAYKTEAYKTDKKEKHT